MQPPGVGVQSRFQAGRKLLSTGEMEVCLSKTMRRLALLLCVLLFFVPLARAQATLVAEDTSTLLRFLLDLESDPTGLLLDSWSNSSLDAQGCPRNWYGVACDQGNVISLVLENLALEGELSSGTIGSLRSLQTLSLFNNSFRGKLPEDFGSLSNISFVKLSDNSFVGSLPGSLVQLPKLSNLSLAGNGFVGPIPDGLSPSLVDLDLSRNNLTSEMPVSMVGLSNLVALNLSSNQLQGGIPSGFENLGHLETLDLHENQLTGSIDPTLLTLNNTRFLDLSSNSFSGRLPWQEEGPMNFPNRYGVVEHVNLSNNQLSDYLNDVAIVFSSSLKVLDLSFNQLFGSVPNFVYVPSLTILRLSGNAFTGPLPPALLQTHLQELDLSLNLLNGSVPPIMSGLLSMLNLSRNFLGGGLPGSLGQCETVDLSFNNFAGDSSAVQNWGNTLKYLDLSHNDLLGPLPDVTQLFQLTSLNLSRNQFVGHIPDSFGSARVLSVLDLSFNQLNGELPSYFFYSSPVTDLLLSHNQFTGPIPLVDPAVSTSGATPESKPGDSTANVLDSLADSTSPSPLQVLDLSGNNLSGPIPGSIGSFVTLEVLNLSENNLSGSIPKMANLTSLQDLDLSQNQLSGPIPSQLPGSLRELNLSNNHLSGSVPKNLAKFPPSSFFPGNTALTLSPGGAPASPPKSSSGQHKNTKGMKGSVKAGLIGGCTAGAAIVLALGVFIYYRSATKSSDTPPGSSQKGFERCGKPGNHATSEFDGDPEQGGPAVIPMVSTGKSVVTTRRGRSSPTENGSPELNDAGGGELFVGGNHRLPVVAEDVMSPEHPLVSKVSPEHPVDMKVGSPQQLVGDVFFLDKTLAFSPEDLSRAPAEPLGRSSHGTSFKATLSSDHILVVKWLKEGLAKSKKDFGTEAKKFGSIKHQNIVSMKGYYWGPREHEKLILSEFIVGGSLADRLYEKSGQSQPPLTWVQRLKIAVDVSQGLLYLHGQHRWAHGNIKASNVLIKEDPKFEALLSDYSLHRLMTPEGTANQIVNAGALGYCAPELSAAKRPKPTFKADVFSFGVILMELITGKSAGDIISANTGVVDLPDWVKLVANEGHAIDCYDTALVGVDRDLEPPKGIEQILALSLSCATPQSSRPSMKAVCDELAAVSAD